MNRNHRWIAFWAITVLLGAVKFLLFQWWGLHPDISDPGIYQRYSDADRTTASLLVLLLPETVLFHIFGVLSLDGLGALLTFFIALGFGAQAFLLVRLANGIIAVYHRIRGRG